MFTDIDNFDLEDDLEEWVTQSQKQGDTVEGVIFAL